MQETMLFSVWTDPRIAQAQKIGCHSPWVRGLFALPAVVVVMAQLVVSVLLVGFRCSFFKRKKTLFQKGGGVREKPIVCILHKKDFQGEVWDILYSYTENLLK